MRPGEDHRVNIVGAHTWGQALEQLRGCQDYFNTVHTHSRVHLTPHLLPAAFLTTVESAGGTAETLKFTAAFVPTETRGGNKPSKGQGVILHRECPYALCNGTSAKLHAGLSPQACNDNRPSPCFLSHSVTAAAIPGYTDLTV